MSCYLCGSTQLRTLTEELREGPGRVVACEQCGLGALDGAFGDLQTYYQVEYRRHHGPTLGRKSTYQELFDAYVGHQDDRVALLQPHFTPAARLLEVGCSTGQFLFNVRDHVGEAIGVDYDAGAAAFAAKATGCQTYGMSLEETGLEAGSFDIVCSMQTLEHVPDPLEFARRLRLYLKPTGIVFVEVPDLADPLLSVYGSEAYRRFYFHGAHLFYFTPSTLTAVMEAASFEGEIAHLQDYNFINHVHWSLTGTPQSTSELGLGPSRLPVADAPIALRRDLEELLDEIDSRYKRLLVQHHATSNIAFIGGPSST